MSVPFGHHSEQARHESYHHISGAAPGEANVVGVNQCMHYGQMYAAKLF